MPRVIRSPRAQEDLIGIWAYIAQDNPAAADGQLRKIGETLRLLARSPLLGEEQPKLSNAVRRLWSARISSSTHRSKTALKWPTYYMVPDDTKICPTSMAAL